MPGAPPDTLGSLAAAVNNWGRWGGDDERGTLNLITAEVRARGASCVRTGKAFSLALPLGPGGPQLGQVRGRDNPHRWMSSINEPLPGDGSGLGINDDVALLGLQAATHWDALAHVSFAGRLYNGFSAGSVSAAGAARCGIDKVGVLVGHGVLLDVARAHATARLDAGYPITAADLNAAEERAAVRVAPGDIVLVRTGQLQLLKQGRRLDYPVPCPGLSISAVEWFRDRDVAAAATDTFVFEVYPYQTADRLPVHRLCLVEMGLTLGENWDLEELAEDCDTDQVYEFFLSATPEPFTGGLGGPVHPVAVK
jgi:kynurenine formamidase